MPSIPCMCFQVTPLSMTPWYLSLHLPNHVTSAPALVPVTHGVPALSFLRPQLSPLGKEFEEPRKDSPSVHSSPSRQCSEYLGRQKSLPTQPQRSSFQPQCGLLPRRWMVAKKGPLSGCKWSHDMPTTLAMQVHGRPWVVQNRGWGEKQGASWGLRDPMYTVFLGPTKDRRELVFCPSHTWHVQMPSLSGVRKVKNNILSCVIQVFSRLVLLKLSLMQGWSEPIPGIFQAPLTESDPVGLAWGPQIYFPTQFWGIAVAAGPQTTVSVALLGPGLAGATSTVTRPLYTHSASQSCSLSLSRIYLNFSSAMLSSWLCFIPLQFLFAIILVAPQEEEKINV